MTPNPSLAARCRRPFPGWVVLWAMTYDELATLEHESWIAYLTGVVSCTTRAEVSHAGGVVTVLTGLPMD